MTIGIIGYGFVGSAIANSLPNSIIVDPAKGHNNSIVDLKNCDGVFVCVPSPQADDGTCDTSILEHVLEELSNIDYQGVIISKCTVPPSTYTKLQESYPNLVHSPEFLTAANAEIDYHLGEFTIIGGAIKAYRNEAERIIRMTQPSLKTVAHCTIAEASLAKYSINSFLATKVVFMNELAQLTRASGADWNQVKSLVSLDKRIGSSHMQVPGPDGEYGFGGMCFPKDTSALLKYAEQQHQSLTVLDTAVKTNLIIRLTEPK